MMTIPADHWRCARCGEFWYLWVPSCKDCAQYDEDKPKLPAWVQRNVRRDLPLVATKELAS